MVGKHDIVESSHCLLVLSWYLSPIHIVLWWSPCLSASIIGDIKLVRRYYTRECDHNPCVGDNTFPSNFHRWLPLDQLVDVMIEWLARWFRNMVSSLAHVASVWVLWLLRTGMATHSITECSAWQHWHRALVYIGSTKLCCWQVFGHVGDSMFDDRGMMH